MTDPLIHPSVVPASLGELLKMANSVLHTVDAFVPLVAPVAGVVPYGGALITGIRYLNPLLEQVVMFAMEEQGKSLGDVLKSIVSHLTPGMPNMPILDAVPNPSGVFSVPGTNPVGE